jgi:hypothetical protein
VLAALTAGTGLLLGGWWVGRFPIERCEPVLGLRSLLLIYAVIVQAGVALGSVLLLAAGMSGVH